MDVALSKILEYTNSNPEASQRKWHLSKETQQDEANKVLKNKIIKDVPVQSDIQYNPVQYSTIRYNPVQSSMTQYNPVHYNYEKLTRYNTKLNETRKTNEIANSTVFQPKEYTRLHWHFMPLQLSKMTLQTQLTLMIEVNKLISIIGKP